MASRDVRTVKLQLDGATPSRDQIVVPGAARTDDENEGLRTTSNAHEPEAA
jgi:hypothetical protein